MFAFSSLFAASQVAAGFDASIEHDAKSGRVNFAFAMLAADTLPTVKKDGNPIGKADFLKLAKAYRDNKGAGYVRGYLKARQWGAALDAIAGALGDAAALTPEQWAELVPAPAKAPKAAAPAAPAPEAEEASEEAPKAAPVAAPAADLPGAVNLVIAGLKAQHVTPQQARALLGALQAAGYAPAPVAAPAPAFAEAVH